MGLVEQEANPRQRRCEASDTTTVRAYFEHIIVLQRPKSAICFVFSPKKRRSWPIRPKGGEGKLGGEAGEQRQVPSKIICFTNTTVLYRLPVAYIFEKPSWTKNARLEQDLTQQYTLCVRQQTLAKARTSTDRAPWCFLADQQATRGR